MPIGKLHRASDEQLIGEVVYHFKSYSEASWWGELSLVEYARISDGSGYVIELEDGGKGRCNLKKRVNRAVTGIPPRYIYHFSGTGPFE